jgi:uncharacterized protein with LGFP repeats
MCEPGLPTSILKALPGGARQTFQSGAIYRNAELDLAVWLKGPVYEEYLVAGGAPGVLGLPVADPRSLGDRAGAGCPGGCSRTDFAHGRIYWKGGIGAFALWGNVLASYNSHGGADGALGFPTSRVLTHDNGSASATFEHGAITCTSGGHCQTS